MRNADKKILIRNEALNQIMNPKINCLLVGLCISFCTLTSAYAQFTYTNNNPGTTIVPYGGSFTYSVSWSGVTNVTLNYLNTPQGEILYGGSPYPGNYTFTYTFNNVNSSYQGSYSLSISSSSGSLTTASVFLDIAPAILVQPQSTTCVSGSSTAMGIVAGPSTATYQWFNEANGSSISGATGSPSFAPVPANNGEYVYCKISNSYGTAYSTPALLTVVAAGVTFTMNNLSETIVPFSSAFTYSLGWNVAGSSSSSASYNFSGNNFSGVSGTCPTNGTFSYSVSNVDNQSPNNFRFTVNGTATPYNVSYFVSPAILTQPQNTLCVAGSPTTMGIVAGPSGAEYQWFNSAGTAISSQSTLAGFSPPTAVNGELVFCRVSNPYGTVDSTPVLLTVVSAPVISNQPANVYLTAPGQSATFSVGATGSGPLYYQWYQNGLPISGANLDSITLPDVTSGDTNNVYQVVVTNAYGQVTSASASISIGAPPTITSQPVSLVVTQGQDAAFTVTVAGSGRFFYQWTENGTNLIDGGDITGSASNTLSITGTTTNDVGTYAVIVTNFYGSVTSSNATLTMSGAPVINSQPLSQNALVGKSVTFSVTATGTPPLYFQWFKNGTNLVDGGNVAGAISNMLALTGVATTDTGAYSVTVANAFGTNASAPASLVVGVPPQKLSVGYGGKGVSLHLAGTANFNYAVQSTTNLAPPIVWQSIATNESDTNGNWVFTDTNTTAYPARFYRATVP